MMTNRNGSKPVCMKNRTPGDRGNSRPMMSNRIEFLDLTGYDSYYTRTVSANSLLIGDPLELFRNFAGGIGCDENGKPPQRAMDAATWPACAPNDGGQRTMSPRSLVVHNAD